VNLYGDLKHERRQTSRLSGCGKAVDACLSGPSAPFDLFAECPLWVGSSHSSIFLHEKYFRQNRKRFFTNSVKVGVGSASNTGGGGDPILGVPPPVSSFESIRTNFSRSRLTQCHYLAISSRGG